MFQPAPNLIVQMTRRIVPVQMVIADDVIFPADRVVESMGAGVSPVAIEIQ